MKAAKQIFFPPLEISFKNSRADLQNNRLIEIHKELEILEEKKRRMSGASLADLVTKIDALRAEFKRESEKAGIK